MDVSKSSNTAASNQRNQRPHPQNPGSAVSQTTDHVPDGKPKPPRLLRTANPNSRSGLSETDNRVHSTSLRTADRTEDYADIYIMDPLDCRLPTRSCFRGGSILEPLQGQSLCNIAPTPYSFARRYQSSATRRNSASGTVTEEEYEIQYSKVQDSSQPDFSCTDDGKGHVNDCKGTARTIHVSRLEHLRQSKNYDDAGMKLRQLAPRSKQTPRFTSEDVVNPDVRGYVAEQETVPEEPQRQALRSDANVKFSRQSSRRKPSRKYDALSWDVEEHADEIENMQTRSVRSSVSSKNIGSGLREVNEAVIEPSFKPPKLRSIKDDPPHSSDESSDLRILPSSEHFRGEHDFLSVRIPRERYRMAPGSRSGQIAHFESIASKTPEVSIRSAHKAVQTVPENAFDKDTLRGSSSSDVRSTSAKSGDDWKPKYVDLSKEFDKNKRELQGILKGSASTQRVQQEGIGNTITFAASNSSTDDTATADIVAIPRANDRPVNAENETQVDKAVQVSIVRPDKTLIACSIIAGVLAITLVAFVLFVLLR